MPHDSQQADKPIPTNTVTDGSRKLKRKAMTPRSEVWEHFTKFTDDDDGRIKARCNYCAREFFCDPKRNGTTSLRNHMNGGCKKHPYGIETRQSQINLQELSSGEGNNEKISIIGTWKYDEEAVRKALAYMVVVDELPFKFVESPGFKYFISVICPRFRIPSRWTVTRDCFQLYIDEKLKLKKFLKESCHRICLTTDTWTSIQRNNYMCLTAHFIDNDWRLNKRILNFCPISSHRGEAIGKAIERCLLDWGIDKIFTITVDNASSNDTAIGYMKKKLVNWGTSIAQGKFLHMRCIAHIVNLIVVDGIKEVGLSVARIRAAVRYVRQSPSRFQKFKECIEIEKIECKRMLCLDVCTRWNSTYLMLDTALKLSRAFERFDEMDPHFGLELDSLNADGMPVEQDWDNVRRLVHFLQHFYELTLRVSGSLYVTSNIFFHEICLLDSMLQEWINDNNSEFKTMAVKMKEKYDKYWGDIERMNMVIFIAIVLDPRHKLDYVQYVLERLHGSEKGEEMAKRIKEAVFAMYKEYKDLTQSSQSERNIDNTQIEESIGTQVRRESKDKWQNSFKKHIGGGVKKSELDRYLKEDNVDDDDNFDILLWWRINSLRFPILSCMARDVLAVPVSTVASESAFSTGGRVLDAFRSSLTPKIVQALICVQDWIRPTLVPVGIEEELADLDKLESDLSKIAVDTVLNEL